MAEAEATCRMLFGRFSETHRLPLGIRHLIDSRPVFLMPRRTLSLSADHQSRASLAQEVHLRSCFLDSFGVRSHVPRFNGLTDNIRPHLRLREASK